MLNEFSLNTWGDVERAMYAHPNLIVPHVDHSFKYILFLCSKCKYVFVAIPFRALHEHEMFSGFAGRTGGEACLEFLAKYNVETEPLYAF